MVAPITNRVFFQPPLETLSRSKGIETVLVQHLRREVVHFGDTFPVEGKGNIYSEVGEEFRDHFGDTFPGEGKGNLRAASINTSRDGFGDTFPVEGKGNSSAGF